ncbi:hypothetical protein OEZ86_001806 [Tetradesmus obliquus]|nr:hypothetical protein OEZ86_001806 [Tetradesmus obliquus]
MDLSGAAGEAAGAAMRAEVMAAPQRRKKGVSGEIREKELAVLPPASLYMGRTQLSLADIRRYNSAQSSMMYTLHDNDCRHYVNSLVQYATGVERSTQHLKRHYFQSRHVDQWLWYGWFISATQFVTDVGNWGHVQAGAAATLLAVTGRSTLAQLKTLALPVMPALTRTLPSLIPTAAAGAAATGAAAGSSSAAGGLATSLKLPAALLLKRPLASSAVAAAGGAGAAAAAIRTVPDAAAVSGSGGGSAGARGGGFGGFGAWSGPLQRFGDGIGQGVKGAVLSIRRAAVGRRAAAAEQARAMEQAAAVAAATAQRPLRAGWRASHAVILGQ